MQHFIILFAFILKLCIYNGTSISFKEFFVYDPVAQSRDQDPVKITKLRNIHIVFSALVDFESFSYFALELHHNIFFVKTILIGNPSHIT